MRKWTNKKPDREGWWGQESLSGDKGIVKVFISGPSFFYESRRGLFKVNNWVGQWTSEPIELPE